MEMKDLMEMWGISNFMAKPAPELLTTIFSYLPYKDLKNAVLVCRWWRKVGDTPSLWSKIKLKFGNWSLPDDPSLQVLSLKRLQSLEYVTNIVSLMQQVGRNCETRFIRIGALENFVCEYSSFSHH